MLHFQKGPPGFDYSVRSVRFPPWPVPSIRFDSVRSMSALRSTGLSGGGSTPRTLPRCASGGSAGPSRRQ
eukprot:11386085-Alexandrium_andersonii.AAC.1